ncbi:MAG TPA: hypothetical protein VLM42_03840 [Bryobacteraceae bacterium]|nr:hypothetical protein [Bryobacteraceae bacterium]
MLRLRGWGSGWAGGGESFCAGADALGALAGVLASKAVALGLGAVCVWRRRYQVIHLINCWYAALVVWNLALITKR